MAAHAGFHASRFSGLRTRLKAFADRLTLDRQLALGVSPDTSPELARRAAVLGGWRVRHRLADGIERVLVEAVAGSPEWGTAAPAQREEVLNAQRELRRLVQALRSEPGPGVRSVAVVSLLLTDGASPVFTPHPHGTLRETAFQAAFHAEAG